MKKKIFIILLCTIIFLEVGGCSNVSYDDLEKVNNEIIEYFSTKENLDNKNYLFNYVDEENNVVVVGLLNNNHEEQEKFKKNVVDSDLIKFVKGEKLVDENCNNDEEKYSFIRTYKILNVAESNDSKYMYLTLRYFQGEEVQTVKVEKELCPNIEENKNYEFTFEVNCIIEDNILSIFKNSKILSIKETSKVGLEQIQESIKQQ